MSNFKILINAKSLSRKLSIIHGDGEAQSPLCAARVTTGPPRPPPSRGLQPQLRHSRPCHGPSLTSAMPAMEQDPSSPEVVEEVVKPGGLSFEVVKKRKVILMLI